MTKNWIFLSFICFYLSIFAQQVEHVSSPVMPSSSSAFTCEMTSSKTIEAEPDEMIFVSFFCQNNSSDVLKEELICELPSNWAIVFDDPSIILNAQDSCVKMFAIKVEALACAGEYFIKIKLKGTNTLFLIRVIIKSQEAFEVIMEDLQDHYPRDKLIKLNLKALNKGNSPLNFQITLSSEPVCSIRPSKNLFLLSPYSEEQFTLFIEPRFCQTEPSQFVSLKIEELETKQLIYETTYTLKATPAFDVDNQSRVYIPSYASALVYGDNRCGTVVAAEYGGEGFIDSEKERYLEYYFCLPTNNQHSNFQNNEELYIGISDPKWDLELGDTLFRLSPLTQGQRYGRGGQLTLKQENWSIGSQYVQDIFCHKNYPDECGGFIELSPSSNWSLSSQYLYRHFYNHCDAHLLTLESEIEWSKQVETVIEFGKNVAANQNKGAIAYRIETTGQLTKDVSFNMNKVYSGKHFCGYYQYLNFFSAAAAFPLDSFSSLNTTYIQSKQSEGECYWKKHLHLIKRQELSSYLTYQYSPSFTFIVNPYLLRYHYKKSHFFQKWAKMNTYIHLKDYDLIGNFSIGCQKNYRTGHTTRFLKQYYLSIERDFGSLLTSIFWQGGHTNYYCVKPWQSNYGLSFLYRYSSSGFLEVIAQKIKQNPNRWRSSQLSVNLQHIFRNQHVFKASIQNFDYKKRCLSVLTVYLSYTIPFATPLYKKKDRGQLEGCLYDYQQKLPISNTLISCGKQQVSTDEQGCFKFTKLYPGSHELTLDTLPTSLTCLDSEQRKVTVKGGQTTRQDIAIISCGMIEGDVMIASLEDLYDEELFELTEAELIEKLQKNPMKDVTVTSICYETQEKRQSITNSSGKFYFDRLHPGRWELKVDSEALPSFYRYNQETVVIQVESNENSVINFSAIPEIPKFQQIN